MKREIRVLFLFLVIALMICCCLTACFGGEDPDSDNGDEGQSGTGQVIYDLASDVVLETSSSSIVYDGTPKTITIYVYTAIGHNRLTQILANKTHEDLVVTYQNNINAGTATATVAAKEGSTKYKGSATIDFTIGRSSKVVNSLEELKAQASNSNNGELTLKTDITIPSATTFEIIEGVTIILEGYDIVNNGTIINNGSILYSKKTIYTASIFNNGTLRNNGSITFFRGRDYLYNKGILEDNGTIVYDKDYGCNLVTNTPIGGTNEVTVSNYNVNIRHNLADCDFVLDASELVYTGQERQPTVTAISKDGQSCVNYSYEVRYENNINAGTAQVIVYAEDSSSNYYGTKAVDFTILKKPNHVANSASEFAKAITNTNYAKITINDIDLSDDLHSYTSDFTIPEGMTLVIDEFWVYFKSTITVNGKLQINDYYYSSSYGNYTSTQYRVNPLKLIVNGEVEIAAGKEVPIGKLSGNGKITNYGGIMLCNRFTDQYLEGATIDNYGEIYEGYKFVGENLDIRAGLKIVNKTSGSAAGKTYINQNTVTAASTNLTLEGSNHTIRQAVAVENLAMQNGENKVAIANYTTPYQLNTVQKGSVYLKLSDGVTYIPLTDATEDNKYYNLTYLHTNGKDGASPVNSGKVGVTLEFDHLSPYFYGSVNTEYEITPITAIISSTLTLEDALKSENYNNYNVPAGVTTEGVGEIKQGETLTIEQNAIVKSSQLTGSGSIINNGVLANSGTTEVVLVEGNPAIDSMLYYFAGNVTNNGTIYLNGYINGALYGDVITRTHIDNVVETSSVENSQYTFDSAYDANDNLITRIEPTLLFEDLTLSTDYTVTYSYSYLATPKDWDRQSYAYAKSDILSTKVYGNRKVYYYINRGTAYVANLKQLKEILQPSYSTISSSATSSNVATYGGTYYSCFERVVLAGDIIDEIQKPTNGKEHIVNFTILRGTTFELGSQYKLQLKGVISLGIYDPDYGYHIENNGTITLEDGNLSDISRSENSYSGTGTILGYANTATSLYNFAHICDTVYLGADLGDAGTIISGNYHTATVDLQGHTITYLGVNLSNNINIVSTGQKASITTLEITTANTDTTISLTNINVGTIDAEGIYGWVWANRLVLNNSSISKYIDNTTGK